MLALDLSGDDNEYNNINSQMKNGKGQNLFLQAMEDKKYNKDIMEGINKQKESFENVNNEYDYDTSNVFDFYSEPIHTVSKILSCFEDDYRIPVLGFGAKLWPLHCVVSHCFGLNSNIFHPLFDSVDDIKAELSSILAKKKILPQGPVIFSEVLKFAKNFAQFCKEAGSKYYVVLVIMTDKELSDAHLFKEELKTSFDYPISVIVCRIVPFKKISSTFGTMNSIKKDKSNEFDEDPNENKTKHKDSNEKDILKVYHEMSQELQTEGRDILHAFCLGQKQKLELTSTARKVFQKLPKQFIQYMEKEQKKPKIQEDSNGSGNSRIKEAKKELMNKLASRKKNIEKSNSLINK
jgi:hypothetical protein